MARSALATLCRPGSPTPPGTATPSGPCAVNVWPKCTVAASEAHQVAVRSPPAEYVTVVGRISFCSAGSSRFRISVRLRPSNRRALAAKYSSTSAWKSRWSRPKLVKPPTANSTPPTRSSCSAWLETSMTTVCTPFSTATAKSACRSVASGVVRALSTVSSPMRVSTVPISPVTRPAALSPASTR
jgi:hypothetical protein